jgi:hypothetical protein
MTRFACLIVLAHLAGLLLPAPASAQPRPPGTTCVTPSGWCPAVQPGPPGARCACQTSGGWIQGTLR